MEIKISNSSYVINFIDVGFNSKFVNELVKTELQDTLTHCNHLELSDWKVYFLFRFTNAPSILIYKKGKALVSEKIKEITIHVPIPTVDLVPWGVNEKQHIYSADHLNNLLKNFDCLDVNYSNFDNREDYIVDCMRRSVRFCFTSGFTVKGIKVKCRFNF